MDLEKLLKEGQVHKEKISPKEIRQALDRADRDLKTARKIMVEDRDWGFAVTYNAILQASRAYMFAQGYRPAHSEGHKNTFTFMKIILGKECEDLIAYFDRMRNKRNQAIYDVAGLITETEAKNLFAKATEFVKLIRGKLMDKGKN